MTKRSTAALQALSLGLTAIDLYAAGAEGGAPEWIKITPRGAFTARDGRHFNVSPEALVARFNADGIAVPIDIDHATAKRAASGQQANAVGWIEQLEARPDGLYGRVNWLFEGLQILANKSHRYISPAFPSDKNGRVSWLHSAALVAAPALPMPAVASAGTTDTGASDMDAKPIALALDLPEDSEQTTILAAILTLKQKSTAAAASLSTLAVGLGKDRVASMRRLHEAKAEEAIRKGVIPPALRDWSLNLMSIDEAQFDTFCASVGAPLGHLFKSAITDEQLATLAAQRGLEVGAIDMSEATSSVANQLGIDPKKLLT